MGKYESPIKGHLDIKSTQHEEEFEGKKIYRNEVLIHGDPEGLRSFANLLLKLADTDQENIASLPTGAKEHEHLDPEFDLSKSSNYVVVGRLDAKGTGEFYDGYLPRED